MVFAYFIFLKTYLIYFSNQINTLMQVRYCSSYTHLVLSALGLNVKKCGIIFEEHLPYRNKTDNSQWSRRLTQSSQTSPEIEKAQLKYNYTTMIIIDAVLI